MRESWSHAWRAGQSCPIIWNCLLVDECHLWWGEDVRDAACSGLPAAMTDMRFGACWCCAWGRQQHNMNSSCSIHGNMHNKHVLHSPETGREEEGLCKVDSMHTKWRPASHMCDFGKCVFSVMEKHSLFALWQWCVVAALTWSRTEVSNCKMVFCCVSMEKVA